MNLQKLILRVVLTAFMPPVLAACDGGPADPIPVPAPTKIGRVENLVPGATATLFGSSLRALKELRLDDDSIARNFVALSDSVATFTVPVLRRCETDGRRIRLVADARDTLVAPLRVQSPVELAVGESRILLPAIGACVQLPARAEDYVLTTASLELPQGAVETPRRLLRLRSLADATLAAAVDDAPAATSHAGRHAGAYTLPSVPQHFATTAVPFDRRVATATVGDTVTMVAWARTEAGDRAICALPREAVPTYKAVVIADAWPIAVLADLRHPQAAQFLVPGAAEWIERATSLASVALVPTMQAVFDRDFVLPQAAGGRYLALMSTLPAGAGGYAFDGTLPGGTWASQAGCAHASEVVTTLLGAGFWLSPQVNRDVYALWSVLVHEYAHVVDVRAHASGGRPRIASSPFSEAWAVNAEEAGYRILTEQPTRARAGLPGFDSPWGYSILDGMWGRGSLESPWQTGGRYTMSAQILLFARDLTGDTIVPGVRRPTLYQRQSPLGPISGDRAEGARALATALSIPLDSLIDRFALASATSGLLDAASAALAGLPRFRSWDVADRVQYEGPRAATFPHRVGRVGNRDIDMNVASGSYAAAYFMADGARGVSFEFVDVGTTPQIVRLTRLR